MLRTGEHVIVPFTVKSLIGTLLLLALFTIPLWWPFRTAASAKTKPDLRGEWIGTVHVTQDIKGIGLEQAVNKNGLCYLKLEMYDGFLERYRGGGELAIKGDRIRALHINQITLGEFFDDARSRAAGGGARLSGTITGDFETTAAPSDTAREINGNAMPTAVRFKTSDDQPGYAFQVELHRGTSAEYDAALRKQQ